jgi:hypothetical protein
MRGQSQRAVLPVPRASASIQPLSRWTAGECFSTERINRLRGREYRQRDLRSHPGKLSANALNQGGWPEARHWRRDRARIAHSAMDQVLRRFVCIGMPRSQGAKEARENATCCTKASQSQSERPGHHRSCFAGQVKSYRIRAEEHLRGAQELPDPASSIRTCLRNCARQAVLCRSRPALWRDAEIPIAGQSQDCSRMIGQLSMSRCRGKRSIAHYTGASRQIRTLGSPVPQSCSIGRSKSEC